MCYADDLYPWVVEVGAVPGDSEFLDAKWKGPAFSEARSGMLPAFAARDGALPTEKVGKGSEGVGQADEVRFFRLDAAYRGGYSAAGLRDFACMRPEFEDAAVTHIAENGLLGCCFEARLHAQR
jgi:hypothetical protein